MTSVLTEIRNEQAAARAQAAKGKGKGREVDVVPEVQIEMSDRREEVNAFEIMGPKSARVLKGEATRDRARTSQSTACSLGLATLLTSDEDRGL